MAQEYRFLRFESVGLATLLYLGIISFPIFKDFILKFVIKDLAIVFGLIGTIFLLSLPLGYIEHQHVVNKYRSPNLLRSSHRILYDLLLNLQNEHGFNFERLNNLNKTSFLSVLLDLIIYSDESIIDHSIRNRIQSRWSHFYARWSVGYLAPSISSILFLCSLALGYLFIRQYLVLMPFNIILTIVLLIILFLINFEVVGKYTEKLWYEINYLESLLIISNLKRIKDILISIISFYDVHPDYINIEWEGYAPWKRLMKMISKLN